MKQGCSKRVRKQVDEDVIDSLIHGQLDVGVHCMIVVLRLVHVRALSSG